MIHRHRFCVLSESQWKSASAIHLIAASKAVSDPSNCVPSKVPMTVRAEMCVLDEITRQSPFPQGEVTEISTLAAAICRRRCSIS